MISSLLKSGTKDSLKAMRFKKQGNVMLKKKRYQDAHLLYSKAIRVQVVDGTAANTRLMAILFANRSATLLKIGEIK